MNNFSSAFCAIVGIVCCFHVTKMTSDQSMESPTMFAHERLLYALIDIKRASFKDKIGLQNMILRWCFGFCSENVLEHSFSSATVYQQ